MRAIPDGDDQSRYDDMVRTEEGRTLFAAIGAAQDALVKMGQACADAHEEKSIALPGGALRRDLLEADAEAAHREAPAVLLSMAGLVMTALAEDTDRAEFEQLDAVIHEMDDERPWLTAEALAGQLARMTTQTSGLRELTARATRIRMLETAVAETCAAVRGYTSGGPPHGVLTGKRSGKAAAMAQTRIKQQEKTCGWQCVDVWAEESWMSADDLWTGVADRMQAPGAVSPLARIGNAVERDMHGVVVFVRNFDTLLSNLAAADQDWALRKTLQTETRIILFGACEQVPAAAVAYERAFYAFFSQRPTS